MNIKPAFLPKLIAGTLASATLFGAAHSYADDTEIFFGGAAVGSQVKPNVLFVLDNSGSMAWRTASNDQPYTGEQSRMTILKQSFSDLISNARNINAGVMVLNSRSAYNGTRMVYPITDIDAAVSSGATSTASQPEILESGDDATQIYTSSAAVIDEDTLPMGYLQIPSYASTPITLAGTGAFLLKDNVSCLLNASLASTPRSSTCNGINQTTLGLNRNNGGTALMFFPGLSIPSNSTIISATLTITPQSTNNNGFDPYVSVQQSKNPTPPNDSSSMATRSFSSFRNLAGTNWWQDTPVTLDVLSELQSLQSLQTTGAIQSVLLKLLGDHNTGRVICMRTGSGCSASELPVLNVTYTSGAAATQARSTALRFQNVGIPQGATITSARIDFAPIASNSEPVTFTIKAENTADASIFTNSTNLSGRAKTSAVATWSPDSWTVQNPPTHVEGPDVTNLVQTVVNLGSWCGNNSMAFHIEPTSGSGSRTALSIEGGYGLQPTLTVQYTGGSGGCLNPIVDMRISQGKNDAWENNDWQETVTLDSDPIRLDLAKIGARYEDVPIVRGAQVLDARVFLTPDADVAAPSLTLNIATENTGNSSQFTSNSGNLTSRTPTTNRACTINNAGGGWTAGIPYQCRPTGLASDLQSIFAKATWNPGNALSLLLTPANDSDLNITSYEGTPAESIKLRLKLSSGGIANVTRTARQEINALVQSMTAGNGTPIVPALSEAVTYYRGERAGFTDPMTSSCQPNHLVLLTDGQANSNTSSAKSDIASLAGACDNTYEDGEICGRELTNWIYRNDLNSTFEGKQNVTVHTIGFALDALGTTNSAPIKAFLNDLASPTSPDSTTKSFYTATSANALNDAFNRIIQSVMSVDTTFVAPGVTVNQFSRKESKNELYYALFRPKATQAWPGNLKRYALSPTGTIIDADGIAAVNSSGSFYDNARSFWSSQDDGNNTEKGGAASNLPDHTTRNIKTWIGDTVSVGGSALYNLDASLLTSSSLATALGGTTQRTSRLATAFAESTSAGQTSLIHWIRGSADGTASGTTQRRAMGDPLHSEPALALYACTTYTDSTYSRCATEDQTVFTGSNEGMLQAFDTSNGIEQFAFMPEALLKNIKTLKANAEITAQIPKVYGLDSNISLWVNDANRNGVIYGGKDPNSSTPALLSGLNPGEFVYAYVTMGRGGRNIYALDVTNRSAPTLLWQIVGGTTGFERLGQTWSAPVPTKIKVSSGSTISTRNVLIFAGGYDPAQDSAESRTADSMGNALYIVDATTGQLIWSASSAGSPTKSLSKMIYGMPASPRVIDLNGDDLADQIFIADMGGQVWRFFINNGNTASDLVSQVDSDNNASLSATDGVFANVGGTGTSGLRRFYNSPDVSLTRHDGKMQLAVSIGSGHRGHPLDTTISDRFYSFRTSQIYNPTFDQSNPTNTLGHSTITESNLYDATENLLQSGTDAEKVAGLSSLNAAKGWMIRLGNTDSGEKALAESLTYAGIVYFTTYSPGDISSSPCQAVPGEGRLYAVNLTDATAYAETGTTPTTSRARATKTVGIPPRPVIVHLDSKSTVCVGTDCDTPAPTLNKNPIPTYWIDQ